MPTLSPTPVDTIDMIAVHKFVIAGYESDAAWYEAQGAPYIAAEYRKYAEERRRKIAELEQIEMTRENVAHGESKNNK